MICLANRAGSRIDVECAHLHHPPKQLEIIELKLEIDSEKER